MGVKTRVCLRLLSIAVLLCRAAFAQAEASELRQKAQNSYATLERLVADPHAGRMGRPEYALRIGQLSNHPELLDALRPNQAAEVDMLEAEELLRTYRFDEAKQILDTYSDTSRYFVRRVRYRWLFLAEDLHAVDSLTSADTTNTFEQTARGELMYRMLRYDDAVAYFEDVLRHPIFYPLEVEAKLGLSKVYQKRHEHQRALDTLATLFTADALSAEILFQAGLVLIDLSRVSEAIDMFEEAVKWNPNSEQAHYYLGNGYARLNYARLREKYPAQFGDSAVTKSLRPAIGHCRNGTWEFAHVAALKAQTDHNQAVEPLTLLGSIAWTCERMDEAADCFRTALLRCPEYGRAHSGLAKALEGKRLRINVHRAEDSLRFAAKEMPQIEKIDVYVVNWKSLSPRHQKQVALAIEPWKLFIPLLAESGHRHYIKPLHERLSEAPGMETIKDQRISYDARLWDDVRGCGGYTTVTGIEDVERTIYSSYNTVLHELTHQVHGVFPPEDAQRLSDRYQEARNLEAAGTKVFMSQYQAASVWEYFAEGANGYYSPRRDKYDTREIVHERLFELDTTLASLVEYYVKAPNLSDCYPVAFVNAAENEIEQQKLTGALNFAQKAYARAPRAEVVLAALSNVYSLKDDDRKAAAFADSLLINYPKKARSYLRAKTAHFFHDGDALEAVNRLEKGVGVVDTTEEKALRQALGDALWYAGRFDEAAEQYRTVLARHSKDSGALWGLGSALGDAGNVAGADSAFQLALLERSGVTDLRLDYARVLLNANRVSEAETQVHEADILSPDDPSVLMMKGQLADARGDASAALKRYDQAIKAWPYDRLPQILRVNALDATGKTKTARQELKRLEKVMKSDVPAWKYHPTRAAYAPAYLWPSFQRELLNSTRKAMH